MVRPMVRCYKIVFEVDLLVGLEKFCDMNSDFRRKFLGLVAVTWLIVWTLNRDTIFASCFLEIITDYIHCYLLS